MGREDIRSWTTLSTTYSYRDEWVALRSDDVLLPNGATLRPFHTVELADGVNIVALTDDEELILIEQYRHAVGCTLVELPAGHIGRSEAPDAAARRELQEETGFSGGTWHYLGPTFIMASRLSSRAHNFLAVGVARSSEPTLDPSEIIHAHRVPWREFWAALASGKLLVSEANQLAAILLASCLLQAKDGHRLVDRSTST
jgi:ADP-ribose pyrophosphatase